MEISRREFLTASLAAGACLATAPLHGSAASAPEGAPSEWRSVRDMFEVDPSLINMAGLILASHPRPVREAIERYRHELDINPVDAVRRCLAGDTENQTRHVLAEYFGCSDDDVALTDSTTMGLGLLYGGMTLSAGDEILTTTHDHMSHLEAIHLAASRSGASVRKVSLYDDPGAATEVEVVSRIEQAVSPATVVVGVTWVHSSTGVKLPIRHIADMLSGLNVGRPAGREIILCVDGVQGVGVEGSSIAALGCDFFVAGTHKWLFGPRGTGFLWGRPCRQGRVQPIIPSFSMLNGRRTWGRAMTPGGFHSFEHRWALSEAIGVHERLGPTRVQAHISSLNMQLKESLAKMPHVRLRTPMSATMSSGITCFDLAGYTADDAVEALRGRGILATVTPYSVKYVRLAPGLLNDSGQVEQTVEAIRGMKKAA